MREVKVYVAGDQLSLAIGKEGQNVRLAAKLTGWKIDVRSITQIQKGELPDEKESEKTETETNAATETTTATDAPDEKKL